MSIPTGPIRPKEPVKLRCKVLADGTRSLYLDIYRSGVRRYEFLRLYLLPGTQPAVRRCNADTLAAAETIRSQRICELARRPAELPPGRQHARMLLLEWMERFYNSPQRKGLKGQKLLRNTIRLLHQYAPQARMRDVDKAFCLGFIDFLRNGYKTRLGKPLTAYGAIGYFGLLRTALNAAVRAEILPENPVNRLSPSEKIRMPESPRVYLTIDEVRTLIATPCPREIVKQAFLFACYCGMRLSDVSSLQWRHIDCDGSRWRATIVMRKTSAPLYLPLSDQAVRWMPPRGGAGETDPVFAGLPHGATVVAVIKRWAAAAGIRKNVHFHTSRHTFATMLLTLGADLYTVSKLLGHTNIKTTQIYAKIVNKKKEEAVRLIDRVFD